MKVEKLLKDIKGLLNKHESFLNQNPEFFFAIEERLMKAVDPDDEDEWQPEGDENYTDEEDEAGVGGLGLFDDEQEGDEEPQYEDEDEEYVNSGKQDEDEDDADAWLKENDPKYAGLSVKDESELDEAPAEDEAAPLDLDDAPAPKQDKKSSSRMMEWKAKDKYHPDHDAKIKAYIADGYSHREAERLVGAHDAPTNFYDALRHSTRPSDPSPKMLERMKGLAHEWLRNADRKTSESAEADVNPQKYASAKVLAAHDAVHKDFTTAHNEFLASDEMKGLTGRARHQKIQEWKAKWHEANPDHREKAIQAASSGKALHEANQARKQRLQDGMASILTAGYSSGEDNPMAGEFSSGAAGETPETRGMQAAAQSVGGEQDDETGGFQTNIKKDPNLVFAEKNKAYIDHMKSKLATKLGPEQAQRMKALDSFKKPQGDE